MQESSFSLSGVQMTRNYVSAIIEGSGIYSYDTYSGQKQQIDFYEYQNLRDQLAQERTKNVVLENRVYSDAKFNTLERQNEAMFGILKSEIAELSCNVPKRPPYFAQGYVACGTPIPAGCCN